MAARAWAQPTCPYFRPPRLPRRRHLVNFYNPHSDHWRQVWVSHYMTIYYVGGLTDDGSMELVGDITYFHNEKIHKMLGRWTPLDDGTVRQYFEECDEKQAKMVPVFTGIYRRKP